jgi:hypothetical protein
MSHSGGNYGTVLGNLQDCRLRGGLNARREIPRLQSGGRGDLWRSCDDRYQSCDLRDLPFVVRSSSEKLREAAL